MSAHCRGAVPAPMRQTMQKEIIKIIKSALSEDRVNNDLTTAACNLGDKTCEAVIIAKQDGILEGIEVCGEVFKIVDKSIIFKTIKKDGQSIKNKEIVAKIKGNASSILRAERTALNFLSFLSGIATKTNYIVKFLNSKNIKILDTRKTLPGLRYLEKHSVKVGGGTNHRMNLADGVLIKDNHLKFISITDAVKNARKKFGGKHKIEVETENLAQVRQAVRAGANIIMLDNMNIETMKKAIKIINGASKIEASGGITQEKLKKMRRLKIDYISMGSLTNSITPVDFSLEIMNKG